MSSYSTDRIQSFPPFVPIGAKILILGSMPGVKSLSEQQYYAHPQNQFWKILFTLFEHPFSKEYPERLKLLTEQNIAVWDTINQCERKGSLDTDIKEEEWNDIKGLLEKHPSIEAIFCNGQKAYKNCQKILKGRLDFPIYLMPSTSPAHASFSFIQKYEQWKSILEYVK